MVSNSHKTTAPVQVGVVGGGQLARMMGESAHGVNVRLTVLATSPDDPAVATCDEVIVDEPTSLTGLTALSERVDVVTFDHELVDLEQIQQLEHQGVVIRPSARALAYAVDKGYQRQRFHEAGLPVPRFVVTSSAKDPRVGELLATCELVVVKSARGGYDGRGVAFPADASDAMRLIDEMTTSGEVVVEERLTLRSEVAQLVARGVDGTSSVYPLVDTVQADGMCVEVTFPSRLDAETRAEAEGLGRAIADLIDAVGIIAVELFVTDAGLVINEVALRPHNTGHWTIEGCLTSQFANHLLCVSGERPGPTHAIVAAAVMVNVVGASVPGSLGEAMAMPTAHVHDYGKAWRPGRKLGHVTVVGDDVATAHVTAWECARAYGTQTREA